MYVLFHFSSRFDDLIRSQKQQLESIKKYNSENSIEKVEKLVKEKDEEAQELITSNLTDVIDACEGNVHEIYNFLFIIRSVSWTVLRHEN